MSNNNQGFGRDCCKLPIAGNPWFSGEPGLNTFKVERLRDCAVAKALPIRIPSHRMRRSILRGCAGGGDSGHFVQKRTELASRSTRGGVCSGGALREGSPSSRSRPAAASARALGSSCGRNQTCSGLSPRMRPCSACCQRALARGSCSGSCSGSCTWGCGSGFGLSGVELEDSTIGKGCVGDKGGLGLMSLMVGESSLDLDLCLCIPPLAYGLVSLAVTAADVVGHEFG